MSAEFRIPKSFRRSQQEIGVVTLAYVVNVFEFTEYNDFSTTVNPVFISFYL